MRFWVFPLLCCINTYSVAGFRATNLISQNVLLVRAMLNLLFVVNTSWFQDTIDQMGGKKELTGIWKACKEGMLASHFPAEYFMYH